MPSIKSVQHFTITICALFFSLFSTLLATPGFTQETTVPDVFGRWLTGDATVEIRDCGDGSPCGYIMKVDAQRSQSDPLLDENNPVESQRTNALVGTILLHGFEEKKGRWRKGRIYNPANGKSYSASMKLETPTRLLVKGCIGPFCQKQNWVRDFPNPQQVPDHAGN